MTTSYLFYFIPIHYNLFFCFSQKFYDEKNKKLDSGPADLMRHEDVKTTSTRKLLPSGKVTGNDNGIPVIPSGPVFGRLADAHRTTSGPPRNIDGAQPLPSILNSLPSASGVPTIVAAGGDIPDIVCGPIPENNESGFTVGSEYSEDWEDSRTESEYESESAMSEMSRGASQWDRELSNSSIAVIQEYTKLKFGN